MPRLHRVCVWHQAGSSETTQQSGFIHHKSRERDKDDGFVVFLGMKRSGGVSLLKSPAGSLCERLV